MNIVVIGRGNVGRGLTALWRKAVHEGTALGRDGGDASDADVVVLAEPGPADATNALPSCNEAFASPAEEVKCFTGAPVAKSFNLNFAALYDHIAAERVPLSSFYVAEDGARDVTEQLITDAGYDPVPLGGLDKARDVEDLTWLLVAAMNDAVPVFYRLAVPGEL
jgi:8-hydroxy-5-deazaflavin:NADPH oxidoreductase